MIQLKLNELQWIMDREGGIGPISPLFGEEFPLKGDEETTLTERGILKDGELRKEYYKDLIPLLDPDRVARVIYEMPMSLYNVHTLSQGGIERVVVRDFDQVTIYPMEELPGVLMDIGSTFFFSAPEMVGDIIKLNSFDFLCYLEALDITRKNLLLNDIRSDLEEPITLPLTAEKVLEKLERPLEDQDVLTQLVWKAFPDKTRGWPEDLTEAVENSLERMAKYGIFEREEEGYHPVLEMQDYADCFAKMNGVMRLEYVQMEDDTIIFSSMLVLRGRYGNMLIMEADDTMIMMGIKGSQILIMLTDYLELTPLDEESPEEDKEEAMRKNEEIRQKRREKMAKMAAEAEVQEKPKAEPKPEPKPEPKVKPEQKPVQKFCPQCGKPYTVGKKFCSQCGKNLQ